MKRRLVAATITVSAVILAVGSVASADPGGGGGAGAGASGPAAVTKLDTGLRALAAAAAQGKPVSSSTPIASTGSVRLIGMDRVENGKVLVNVYVNGSVAAAADQLRGLGMDVTGTSNSEPERVVAGWVPAAALTRVASLSATRAIVASHGMSDAAEGLGGTDTGSVLSEGDAALHGPQARALGTNGAGVKVGVISDSINRGTNGSNGIATSVGTGDLPAGTTTLADDPAGADEGRAMAEIIYDEAPGLSQMVFSTGTISAAGKATSINNLVAQGVKVIADDIFYPDEPMFQDGIVSQAVDAAKAAGVAYFASAGNRARQSWEGTLSAGPDNDFDPGAGVDTVQTVGTFTNRSPFLSLQWAEPWGHATTDLSVEVFVDGASIGTVNDNNVVNGIPLEIFGVTLNGTHTLAISIHRISGAGTPKLKYIVGGTPAFTVAEFPTNSNAINPDAASATGSMAVAASAFGTPTTPETFSSRGPSITRYFDKLGNALASPETRAKPQLDAPDGVHTTLPPASGLNPFFGTSAATPAAAGVATLLLAANPGLTVDLIRTIMTNPANTLACATGTPAADCGAGFILADSAVTQAKSFLGSPPVVTAKLSPAAPNGKGGWYTSAVSVSFTVSDPETPVVETTGCAPASVTANGSTSLTCTALSAGGKGQATVTLKLDGTGPTNLKAKGLKKNYAHGTKPDKKKIKCNAKDAESGIAKCKIKGISTSKGKHTATVIATNNAGLVTKKKFKYTIQ